MKKADVIFSEFLCFVYSHFGSTPLSSILTVVSGFLSEAKVSKAKITIYDICKKLLDKDELPRIITRKSDNKKKSECDDIGSLVTLLDEHKVDLPKFAALSVKRIPSIDPSHVDLCFLLESVEDLRSKVDALLSIKKDLSDSQNQVRSISTIKAPPARSYQSALISNLSNQSGNGSGGQSSSSASQLAVRKFSQPNVVHLP